MRKFGPFNLHKLAFLVSVPVTLWVGLWLGSQIMLLGNSQELITPIGRYATWALTLGALLSGMLPKSALSKINEDIVFTSLIAFGAGTFFGLSRWDPFLLLTILGLLVSFYYLFFIGMFLRWIGVELWDWLKT